MHFIRSSSVALALIATCGQYFAMSNEGHRLGGHAPIEISMTDGTVGPGHTVTYRVVLDGYPTSDQFVTIGSTDKSAYASLPSEVVVPANSDRVSFQATLSTNLPSSWSTTATAEGKTVWIAQASQMKIGK